MQESKQFISEWSKLNFILFININCISISKSDSFIYIIFKSSGVKGSAQCVFYSHRMQKIEQEMRLSMIVGLFSYILIFLVSLASIAKRQNL